MTAKDRPLTPAFLRRLGFRGDEETCRVEEPGPSMDGRRHGLVEVRRWGGPTVLVWSVAVSNPTEAECLAAYKAAGIPVPEGA